MTEITAAPEPMTSSRGKGRRVRAILAGGLVLGVGAAITLAAWNDSEFATGTFTAGHFDIEGSTDGTAFADNDSAPEAAAVVFSTGFNNLSPETTVSAPFVLHLDATTDYDATVDVASAVATGAATPELTYGIVVVDDFDACTPTATGATVIPDGTALDSITDAAPFSLAKSTSIGTAPGADVFLCVQVTSSADLVQSSTAVGTWQFTATSA